MRKFLLFFVLLSAACKKGGAPLSEDKMAAVLADIHIAEMRSTQAPRDSVANTGVRNIDTLAVWYNSVFQHHNLSRGQFRDAMKWYEAHPVALDSVYKRSVRILEAASADTTTKAEP